MAKLYANENFPLKVVQELRELGHDVLTSQEAGKASLSIPDIEVLAFATENERALLTINRKDFIHLHQNGDRHEGVIVCTQDSDIKGQAERIHEAIMSSQSLSGQLIRINRPQR
jgi:predicted nuclease of predicted toxin-antitoxin system